MLPAWLRYTGIALAIAMASSGVPYLSLLQGGAVLAYVSGPLLLLFITGTGIVLGTSAGKPSHVTEPALTHPAKRRVRSSVARLNHASSPGPAQRRTPASG